MFRFLLGVIAGILLFLLFIYFGGGKTVTKVGEGLTETGKKMEQLEDVIKKEKDAVGKDIRKKMIKDSKEAPRQGQ